MSDDVERGTSTATGTWSPKIVAFVCNWCTYTGADLAGTSRLKMDPNVRVIRLTCSSRVNPLVHHQGVRAWC